MIGIIKIMEKEKTIYLMGGLGNVLFQLNFAHNLRDNGIAIKINTLLIDNSFLLQRVLRWSFHGTKSIIDKIELLKFFDYNNLISMHLVYGAISKIIREDFFSASYCGLFAPRYSNLCGTHLFGYFQLNNNINLGFTNEIKKNIFNIFYSSQYKYLRDIMQFIGENFVVHVRGGDYKLNPSLVLDVAYYKKALLGEEFFFIVTDDRPYAKKLFSDMPIPYYIVETHGALEDFIVIMMSKKKILANSTFSWWAAELSDEGSLIIQKNRFLIT